MTGWAADPVVRGRFGHRVTGWAADPVVGPLAGWVGLPCAAVGAAA